MFGMPGRTDMENNWPRSAPVGRWPALCTQVADFRLPTPDSQPQIAVDSFLKRRQIERQVKSSPRRWINLIAGGIVSADRAFAICDLRFVLQKKRRPPSTAKNNALQWKLLWASPNWMLEGIQWIIGYLRTGSIFVENSFSDLL